MDITVFLPRPGAHLGIDRGSGIVGTPESADAVTVDYQGNANDSDNLRAFADRVDVAAGRHRDRYPTIARSRVPAADLVRVGTYDPSTGVVDLAAAEDGPEGALAALAAWCGLAAADMPEQLRTTNARHQMRREVEAARASGDPARVFAADQMARRYQLDD